MNQPLRPVPNSTGVLVLGILSIFGLCCLGIPGLTMGIIALFLHKQGLAAYYEQPEIYNPSGLSTMNAGKICAIIGVVLASLSFIFSMYDMATTGMNFIDAFRYEY